MGRRILILGGGPSGLAAAYRLTREKLGSVVLIEMGDGFGGRARTIAWRGHRLDIGSHRLGLDGDPRVLADLKRLLGTDLIARPSRARIRLLRRWIPFPVPPRSLFSRLRLKVHTGRLPPGICRETLFSGPRHFHYPRGGFGQISEALADGARRLGADLRLRHRITELEHDNGEWRATVLHGNETSHIVADLVIAAIPVPHLAGLLTPEPPAAVRDAANGLEFRGMILVFLEFEVDRFTEYDLHHLPSNRFRVARISEPKAFADRRDPAGRTVLCAEIPCAAGDPLWQESEVEMAGLVTEELQRAGLALPCLPRAAHVMHQPFALPAWTAGDGAVERYLREQPGLIVPGPQEVGAAGHTQAALAAAYAEVDRLS